MAFPPPPDGVPAVEPDIRGATTIRAQLAKHRWLLFLDADVHVAPDATHIAILEGRSLVEHFVSRPADDVAQIHGNIYVGRVENVLPGMEAAFIDIATPKNAVLYRSDVQYDPDDVDTKGGEPPRIEDVLKARQLILCQVTKNPIAHKGARLTQEVSLPGRFVVLVPNSRTFGISKRLPDDERKKIALFTNVPVDSVVTAVDVDSIYKIPGILHAQGLDATVCRKLAIEAPPADLSQWEKLIDALEHPESLA